MSKVPPGGITAQLRKLTKIAEGDKLLLLDLPDGGSFFEGDSSVFDAAATADAVKAFLAGTKDGTVAKKSVG